MSPGISAIAAVLPLAACSADPPAPEPPPSETPRTAILITVDTLRADALSFAGNSRAATPALDRLAAAGRVFDDTHAHCVTTLPSHASILTGLYPYQHGARHNGGFVLGEDVPTLASILRDAGFATAAVVGAFPVAERFGLGHGFDLYDDDFGGGRAGDDVFGYSERDSGEGVERALAWWRAAARYPRFLWLHLFDPHAPYAPPEPFRSRFAEDPYLGEVAAVDAYLSELLDGFLAGTEEPTLIVFTADHGEALGEHGEATHGLFAYEPTLKVPLVLWGPGVEPGVDSRPARHVDLLPTVLDALDLEPAPELPGRALPGRTLLAPAAGHPDVSFFEALSGHLDYGWAPLRGVLEGGKKYVDLPVPELYDLGRDPAEADNLFPGRRRSGRELAELLPAESAWPPAAGEVSAEERVRLRSLGYLGGPTASKSSYGPEDDPKRLVALDGKVQRMAELSTSDPRRAIALGREILAARPSMGVVYVYLSTLLLRAGDPGAAIEVMQQARSEGVASHDLERQLGLTLVNTGRAAEAIEVLEPLAEADGDAEAGNFLALAYTYLGRHAAAESILRRLLDADPANPRTWENLSFLAITKGRYQDAHDHAQEAIKLGSGLVSSWNNLGVALYHLRRKPEAPGAWRHSLEPAPGDADALLPLGMVEADAGSVEAARDALTRFLEIASGPGYEAKRNQAREILRALESE